MPALSLGRLTVAGFLAFALVATAAGPAYADETTGTVAGHLLDGTTPLADVGVVLQSSDGSADIATTVTDAAGAFTMAEVPPGDYLVRFDLPGGVRQYFHQTHRAQDGAQTITVAAGGQTDVEETVGASGSVTGRIVTSGGDPVAGAPVTLDDGYGDEFPTATTDSNGEYTIPYVWPGSYLMKFVDPGSQLTQYVPAAASPELASAVTVGAGAPLVVNETLLPIGTVSGTATRYTSSPARGTVEVFRAGGELMNSTTFNSDGSFSLLAFAGPVQVSFAVRAGSTATTVQWYRQQGSRSTAEIIDVPGGGTVSITDSIIDFGGIGGRLTDPTGAGVANATVVATSGSRTLRTTTDANGKYRLSVPTDTYKVRFEASGIVQWAYGKYSAAQAASISVGVNVTATVNDVLRPGQPPAQTGIAGKLTDNGTAVSGAQVAVFSEFQDWIESTTTDDNGSYALPNVGAGTYKVKFTLPGYLGQWAHQKWDFESADPVVVVEGAATTLNEEVAPHGQITGQLTHPDGSPVSFQEVNATSVDGRIAVSAQTDGDGRYTFPIVPAGDYRVAFRPFGYGGLTQFATQQTRAADADVITVGAGATVTVDDQVLPPATVTGRLTDKGEPVADAQVYLYDAVDGGVTQSWTDSNGDYLAQVWPGRYKVNFILPNGLAQWAHQVRDEADAAVLTFAAGTNVVNEELIPTSTLRGHLTDHEGNPVTNATIEISGGNESFNAYVDDSGDWSVTVPPGTYKVRFVTDTASQWARGRTTATQADPITVGAGQTVVVDDSLLAPGSLTVTAKDAATGAAIVTFCAYADNGGITNACTTDGTLEFPALSAGVYTIGSYVEDEASDYLLSETSGVVVTTGQQASLAVKLTKGATFKTVVKDAATGAPVAGACVELVKTDRPSHLGTSRRICANAQGVITQNKISPDEYNAFVWVSDGVHGRQWVGASGGVGAQAKAKKLTLTSGKTTTLATIKLDKAGSVRGVITDKATGAPVANAIVHVSSFNDGHGGGPLVTTDELGRYTIGDLGPYDWTLFFRHREYAAQWSGDVPNRLLADGVKVKAGKTTQYNVKLRAGTTLTGKVVGANGQATNSARVTVINAVTNDEMGSGDTSANGTYAVRVFGPQLIKLRIEGSAGDTWGTEFYLNADTLGRAQTILVPVSGTKTVNITFTP